MLSHAAVLAGRADWMPALTAAVAGVVGLAMIVAAPDRRARLLWGVGLAVLAAIWALAPAWLVYLPPAAINVAFGTYFASTLRAGREPRIARFARMERGGTLPLDLARYTRRLTWIWTVLFFGSAVAGLALAAFAPIEVWSTFANVASYLLVAALFVGEYLWRKMRFRQYRHAPLHELLRNVVRDGRFPDA